MGEKLKDRGLEQVTKENRKENKKEKENWIMFVGGSLDVVKSTQDRN